MKNFIYNETVILVGGSKVSLNLLKPISHLHPIFAADSGANILVSENRDVYIVISNLLALYILSVAEYCSKELILIIESLIFPNMSNLSLSGKKRKLGEFSNILGDFHINELIKSKNIILELKDKAIMLRDFYWNIEEEKIYLYCPLINDTIKDCNSGIESVGKLLGECSHMVKYHRKNMEV